MSYHIVLLAVGLQVKCRAPSVTQVFYLWLTAQPHINYLNIKGWLFTFLEFMHIWESLCFVLKSKWLLAWWCVPRSKLFPLGIATFWNLHGFILWESVLLILLVFLYWWLFPLLILCLDICWIIFYSYKEYKNLYKIYIEYTPYNVMSWLMASALGVRLTYLFKSS